MAGLGYATDGSDTSSAATVGGVAAEKVVEFRRSDGANQLNRHADTSGCRPVNTWDQVLSPDHWQPLCVPRPPPGAIDCPAVQKFVTPSFPEYLSGALHLQRCRGHAAEGGHRQ
jgi:hypothetical protein